MRTRSNRARRCPVCAVPMKKNGHTAAGAQRWKCTSCALSTTCPSGRARRHEQADELADFIAWATSRHTQDEQEGSARAFRRRTCWCWQVPVPHPPVTGQVHDQIFIDGMHLSGGWVLLIARDREHVLEWQWAANESAQAYTALLERLAPADVVTTDGAAGALAAIAHLWPSTRVQAAWSTFIVTSSATSPCIPEPNPHGRCWPCHDA